MYLAPILPIPVDGSSDRVAIDVLGQFVESTKGNKYVIELSDYYIRWPEAFAVATLLIEEIIYRHGTPRTLLFRSWFQFPFKICKRINSAGRKTFLYKSVSSSEQWFGRKVQWYLGPNYFLFPC